MTTEEDLAKFSDGSEDRLKDAPVVDLEDVTVCLRFYDFIHVKKKTLSVPRMKMKWDLVQYLSLRANMMEISGLDFWIAGQNSPTILTGQ